ncbi:hypothetical protein Tco_0267542, partial [Tanacetum coccineum]
MRWFSRKEFPWYSAVDGIDGDMVLETLLNDNPIRIRRYPKDFLVLIGLSCLWYAAAAHPVFYDDDDEEENEKPILEQTADVVTPPSDQNVSLGHVPLDQVFLVAALPPPTNGRKRTLIQAPVGESALKKGEECGGLALALL